MDATTPTSLTDSRKGQGLILGILGVLLAGAAAVAVGGTAMISQALITVVSGIVGMVGTHQIAQAQQDKAVANASACNAPASPDASPPEK